MTARRSVAQGACSVDSGRGKRWTAEIRGWRPKSKLYSLNARQGWAARFRLASLAKDYTWLAIKQANWPLEQLSGRYVCTITIRQRLGRLPDGDNLQGCAKAIRDTVALALGVDDGSEWVEWRYVSERGPDGVLLSLEEVA